MRVFTSLYVNSGLSYYTTEVPYMAGLSNALCALKGRAVACPSFFSSKFSKNSKLIKFVVAAFGALAVTHPALASSSADLFSSQSTTVSNTFGHGSSIEKWIYYAEIIIALAVYIKARNPLVFVGIAMVMIFTRVAFGIAG